MIQLLRRPKMPRDMADIYRGATMKKAKPKLRWDTNMLFRAHFDRAEYVGSVRPALYEGLVDGRVITIPTDLAAARRAVESAMGRKAK